MFLPAEKGVFMNKNIIISFLAVLTVIGFGWGFYETQKTNEAAVRIENDAARAYYELTDAADQLTVLTGKALVVSDNDNRSDLYSKISRTAYVAQENLSMLPVYNSTLSRTEQFLNQIGDFSASLVAKAARSETLTAEEADTLKELNAEVTKVADALHKMEESKENIFSYKAIQAADKSIKKNDYENAGLAVTSLNDINTTISKTPALIYDGPYSDHLENKGPVELSGETIDWSTAKETAARLLGENYFYEAYGKSSKAAGIAVYTVAVKYKEENEAPFAYFDVSVRGGYPVQYTSATDNGQQKITKEKALKIASEFLEKAGYGNMKAGYHLTKNNVLTANFTYQLGDTTVYPDMIKVSVDLSNGRVSGLDAKNYLEFHKDRALPALIMTEDAAREHLPEGITPISVQKALIPKANETEVLCYEFRFRENETEYLTYINAETGKEEDVFIVKDDESGTFTL